MKQNGMSSDGAVVSAELHRKVLAIFADIFQIEIDADAEDIGRNEIGSWDSVSHLRLVAEIEELFGTTLSDEEVTTIACLRDIEILLSNRCL